MSNNKALVYIRTSTDDRQDASPDVQISKITEFCNRNGWEIVARYDDYLSGATELVKRPGLSRLVAHAKREGIKKIVVLRIDRAFREMEVMISVTKMLSKFNCRIIGVDDPVQDDGSASSKLLRNMLASAAEFDRVP